MILSFVLAWMPGHLMGQDELADQLRQFSPIVFSDDEREAMKEMLRADLRRRLQVSNQRSSAAWTAIENRDQWEAFSKPIVEKLKRSLGTFPEPVNPVPSGITGEIAGEGFRILNLVFESRPGLCREFEAGSPECFQARRAVGIM